MSTTYPGTIDQYSTKVDHTDDVRAAHVNDLQAAIVAIETVLGTNPQDSFANVATRLATNPQNVLVNGDWALAQRQTPGTDTTIPDNGYSADRWRATRENADLRYMRQDAWSESGLTGRYFGRFSKATNAGKILICQIVEGANAAPLRGRRVIFQAKLKASASKTLRLAILELQAAGTMDVLPGALVSTWGGSTVDPTWGANLAVVTAATSAAVTTAWQNFAVSVTVPATSKNLLCAVWSDSPFAAGDWLAIAEAGLYDGSALRPWLPRPVADEILLCQRYFEKTYALDVAPGTATEGGAVVSGAQTGWILYQPTTPFMVVKRSTPTVTIYNSQNGTAAQASEYDSGSIFVANRAVTAIHVGPHGTGMQAAAGTFVSGNFERWHYTAQSEL